MEAVYGIFLAVCMALGWMFNLLVILTFLWNRIPVSKRLFFISLVPFGAWLFCVGVLIGAGLLVLLHPGEYST